MANQLTNLLWQRIDEVLRREGLDRKWLKLKLKEAGINHKNKNTLTDWFSERGPTSFDQIADLARALKVEPAELLFRSTPAPQLELPFQEGTQMARMEIECRDDGILLRRVETSSDAPSS